MAGFQAVGVVTMLLWAFGVLQQLVQAAGGGAQPAAEEQLEETAETGFLCWWLDRLAQGDSPPEVSFELTASASALDDIQVPGDDTLDQLLQVIDGGVECHLDGHARCCPRSGPWRD